MAGERVLIVDDEESIRALLERLCLDEGYRVVVAASGAGARQALEQEPAQVCIFDLRLPDASGIELLRYAKQLNPSCEVIILTAYADRDTAIEALRLGAYEYLQKPVQDIRQITLAVAQALERQELALHNERLLQELEIANDELERRRRQQLQYIRYIGNALSGALSHDDVSQVLLQAIIESTDCDGAAILLLPDKPSDSPWALTGGKSTLTPQAQQALVQALLEHLPDAARTSLDAVDVRSLAPVLVDELNGAPWLRYEFGLLVTRDVLEGAVVIARHVDEPFSQECLDYFAILIGQGRAALANARLFSRANELATRDGLTGLCNHRHFFERLYAEISRAERHGENVGVIMMDIDRGTGSGLKMINDTFGHQAGDQALQDLARFLEQNVRCSDLVARYGGDEFIILAPHTDQEDILLLANRICRMIAQTPFTAAGHTVYMTMSMGAAVFSPGCGQSASSVVSLADRGMYLAKERGGNQVCMISDAE